MAENAPELLSERPIKKKHVEDLLGPARSPRMPTNLIERRAEQQEGLRKGN